MDKKLGPSPPPPSAPSLLKQLILIIIIDIRYKSSIICSSS